MKGIILEKGFDYYTYMNLILSPIEKHIVKYNWLITDCECNYYPDSRIGNEYEWLSGEDVLDVVKNHDIQFIWAVFSAFPKDITFEQIKEYDLPYADGYTGFWKNPISIQHPLAVMEIVPWDSSLVLLISKDEQVISAFTTHFPLCEDLELYNARE